MCDAENPMRRLGWEARANTSQPDSLKMPGNEPTKPSPCKKVCGPVSLCSVCVLLSLCNPLIKDLSLEWRMTKSALTRWSTEELETAILSAHWITFKCMRLNVSCASASWRQTENSRAAPVIRLDACLRARNVRCCSGYFLAHCYWLSLTLRRLTRAYPLRLSHQLPDADA